MEPDDSGGCGPRQFPSLWYVARSRSDILPPGHRREESKKERKSPGIFGFFSKEKLKPMIPVPHLVFSPEIPRATRSQPNQGEFPHFGCFFRVARRRNLRKR